MKVRIKVKEWLAYFVLATAFLFMPISFFSYGIGPFLIALVIDLVFWIIAIGSIVRSINEKNVEKYGKEYDAIFVSFYSNVTVNGVKMCYIIYTYKNEYGEIKECKSPSNYTYQEAMMFEMAETFKIKVYKNRSVIVSKPFELAHKKENKNVTKLNKSVCKYCGHVYGAEHNKCPSCGANKTE